MSKWKKELKEKCKGLTVAQLEDVYLFATFIRIKDKILVDEFGRVSIIIQPHKLMNDKQRLANL